MIRLATQFDFICAFNTGRGYSAHGQRIVVFGVVVDGALRAYYMNDVDRGVCYYFKPLDESIGWDMNEVRSYVMHAYDLDLNKVYGYTLSDDLYAAEHETQNVMEALIGELTFTKWSPIYL